MNQTVTHERPHMSRSSMMTSFNRAAEDTIGKIPEGMTDYVIFMMAMQRNAEKAVLFWFNVKFQQDSSVLRGSKGPVLVLPGFCTDDEFTYPMRKALNDRGYGVYGWNNGENEGPTQQALDHLESRIEEIYRLEGRPVTIVGHSLGGIFGRELARVRPEMVKEVITLGSPYDKDEKAVPVPVTSIYTPTDEAVGDWRKFIRKEHNVVQVDGSHVDLVKNPKAINEVLSVLESSEAAPSRKTQGSPAYQLN